MPFLDSGRDVGWQWSKLTSFQATRDLKSQKLARERKAHLQRGSLTCLQREASAKPTHKTARKTSHGALQQNVQEVHSHSQLCPSTKQMNSETHCTY